MKMNLLQMVQSIMSDMDSDVVTSIADTDEAGQVASTLRDVYFQLVSTQTIPEFESLLQLEDAGTALVYMKIPDIVKQVYSIRYNVKRATDTFDQIKPIQFYPVQDFLDRITNNKSDDTNIVSATDPTSGLAIFVRKDKPPEYWTSFDDKYITFDSYDAVADTSGLVASKTLCWGTNNQDTFSLIDSFTPVMDDNFFPLLLAEAKSTCMMNLKQQANPKIERQARNQRIWLQNEKFRTAATENEAISPAYPNYGRRRGSH